MMKKAGADCSNKYDIKSYVSNISSQHHSFLFQCKTEECCTSLATMDISIFKGLKILQQENMVTDLPQIERPLEICDECIVSKQHCDSFPTTKSWRGKKPLELVHWDISLLSLKTIVGRHEFTPCKKNQKPLKFLKSLKCLLKKNLEIQSMFFARIVAHMNLQVFEIGMESRDNLQ